MFKTIKQNIKDLQELIAKHNDELYGKLPSYFDFYYNHSKGKVGIKERLDNLISDFEELDVKFDALCEYLKVEFVNTKIEENISDGSDVADRFSKKETFVCRKKVIK